MMSTLISKPETVIKPETPMPSPTSKSSSSTTDEVSTSRMNDNARTGFISSPPPSNHGGTPPKSPVQAKPVWSNSTHQQQSVNPASGPARYQNHQNYGSAQHHVKHGPYALDRGDGTVSRLIPVDELPFDIVGVPRREAPGTFHIVFGQDSQKAPYQVVRVGRVSPPVGLGLSYQGSQPAMHVNPIDTSRMPFPPVMAPTPAQTYPQADLQNYINDLTLNPRPRVHQAQNAVRRQKIYCDKWLQTGNCGFQQVGCKYKHEMPMDRATQESVGLNGLPDWWSKAHGIALKPQNPNAARLATPGRPADRSWRNREAENGSMRMANREFDYHPVVSPTRKPAPVGRQLGGPTSMESLGSQLDALNGGLGNTVSDRDRRAMGAAFGDLGIPLHPESRRDFGAIGDRLVDRHGNISTSFPSPSRSLASNSASSGHYALLGEMADQREKKFDVAGINLDDDSQSDYSGGITPF